MPRKIVFAQTALPSPPPAAAVPKTMTFTQQTLPDSAKLPPPPKEVKTVAFAGQREVTGFDALVAAAKVLDPKIAADPMFIARLRRCATMRPLEWMNWADDRLEALRVAAEAQVKISVAFRDLKVDVWCDDAREHASKKPSFMDAFRPGITPEFYDSQLQRCRAELTTLAQKAVAAKDALTPKMQDLQLDSVIFQVVTKTLTDPTAIQIADSKLRSLITGVQTGMMAQTAMDSSINAIMTSIQAIDQVRNNVIPAWRIATASR